jgi:hypothetical protein
VRSALLVARSRFVVPDGQGARLRDAAPRTSNQQPATRSFAERWPIVVALILLAPALSACPVCFGGSPNDPMVKGVNNGIWVLLALVALVQVGFAAMFWSFWRRAREHKRFRDSLRVIHSYDREGPFS